MTLVEEDERQMSKRHDYQKIKKEVVDCIQRPGWRKGPVVMVNKYRNIMRELERAKMRYIAVSGILQIVGNNSINLSVKERVRFVDLLFFQEEMFIRNRIHLTDRGTGILGDKLVRRSKSAGLKLLKLLEWGGTWILPKQRVMIYPI